MGHVEAAVGAAPGAAAMNDPRDNGRRLLFALFVAYLCAGAVLAFALLELEAVADQLNTTPFCRRI